MIIIDKIKKAAPKWVEPKIPNLITKLDKEKYYEKEKERWREGYGSGYSKICGMHYLYLTQGRLKDGSDGNYIKPKYRDCDEWMIEPIHEAFWGLEHNIGIVKRREIGLTSIGAGLLPVYTMKMFPNSKTGLTSCDQPRIHAAYTDKFDPFIRGLNNDIKPVFDKTLGWKENSTKQNIYARLPFYIKNKENGELELNYAELYAKETTSDDEAAKGMSGTRMRAAFLDEFPLHKRKQILLGSMRPAMMKGMNQSGFILWGGTVEEGITPEQIAQLSSLVEDSKLFNFKVLFAPAWWGLKMDENGVSDEKAGLKWVEEEREKLYKADDKTLYKNFVKNYPLSLDEIFSMGGGGRFDEETVDNINVQMSEILKKKPPVICHDIKVTKVIKESDTELIEAILKEESSLRILEHPVPNVDYMFGYDGISTSLLTSEKQNNSKMALVGMKGVDPQSELQFAPIAIFSERPRSIEYGNKKMVDVVKYYNRYGRAKITGELNAAGEHMITALINAGLSKCILNRKDLSKKGYVDTKKMWFTRGDAILSWQNEACNIYYKKYAHMVWFKTLLLDAQKKDSDNYDEEDALKACLYGWGTGDLLGEKPKEKKKRTFSYLTYVNGKPVWEERQI